MSIALMPTTSTSTSRPNTCFAVGIVSKYQSNLEPLHWVVVKHILKYLRRTIDYMFVYHGEDLIAIGYTDSNFESDCDSRISTLGYVFIVGGGAISWRNAKQCFIADPTMHGGWKSCGLWSGNCSCLAQ